MRKFPIVGVIQYRTNANMTGVADITRAQIQSFVETFEWFREPAKRGYLDAALDRYVHTLNVIPRLPEPESVRVLEIGGMPYFMTVLIKKFLGYHVRVANEPTMDRGPGQNREVLVNDDGERFEIGYEAFNVEYDTWPYEDGRFDMVVYCEVIEHLVYDPTHTLVESHRVLRQGGTLLVSTPNALAYTGLVQLIRGENPYPPYSGYSHYARHHRLFSCDELSYLCEAVGFDVQSCYSVYDSAYIHPKRLDPLMRALSSRGRAPKRHDVIYLLASAGVRRRYAYPDRPPYRIYSDVQGYGRVDSGVVRMSEETPQLVEGFYYLEDWGGGVRWTSDRARLFLRRRDEDTLVLTLYAGPRPDGEQVRGWVTISDEGLSFEDKHPFALPAQSWQTVTLPVRENAPSKLLVEIGVDNPAVPSQVEPGNKDGRRLGVAVKEVALTFS